MILGGRSLRLIILRGVRSDNAGALGHISDPTDLALDLWEQGIHPGTRGQKLEGGHVSMQTWSELDYITLSLLYVLFCGAHPECFCDWEKFPCQRGDPVAFPFRATLKTSYTSCQLNFLQSNIL